MTSELTPEQIAELRRAAIAVARDGRTDDEWFYYLQCVHHKYILALLDDLEARDKRIAELSEEFFSLPPLNDDLIAILGRPNFTCAHLAELLRKGGQDIRRKSEHEQAAVIHWFLDLYLKYGDKWEGIAKDDIRARAAMLTDGISLQKGEE